MLGKTLKFRIFVLNVVLRSATETTQNQRKGYLTSKIYN